MKKNLKTILAAAAVLFASCQNEQLVSDSSSDQTTHASDYVATTESYDAQTKTSLDSEGNVLWKKGDQLTVFGGSTTNKKYQVKDGSNGKTSANLDLIPEDGYTAGTELPANIAYYPYSSTNEIRKNGETSYNVTVTLPATQAYAENSFGNGSFPMVAVTTGTSDKNLTFKNVLGGLKLQLKGTVAIRSISVTGNNDEKLYGAATVTASNGSDPTIALSDASAKTVTLDCGDSGVQLNTETATNFVISLPPMTMVGGFTIDITDTDGGIQQITTTNPQPITRSRLLKMPEVTVATNPTHNGYEYVDLGLPSGVLWATFNVGATKPYEYGDYFAWGATEPLYETGYAQEDPQAHWKAGKSAGYTYGNAPYQTESTTDYRLTKWTKYLGSTTTSYKDPSATNSNALKIILDPEDDAAYVNWGGSWRMPTKEEQDELRYYCTWTWYAEGNKEFNGVAGYKVQSKTIGCTDKWIFLPVAGGRGLLNLTSVGEEGEYWSSSLDTSYPFFAFVLFASSYNAGNWSEQYRHLGHSVRPVYSEEPSSGIRGISLNKNSISLQVDEEEILASTISRTSGAVNTQVEWSSSDASVATVDYTGKVTAVSAGTATITAKTVFGGYIANCVVTIVMPAPPYDGYENGYKYVDLGLRVRWATFNVGANKPEGYGDGFAWGDTNPKTKDRDWSTYKHGTSYDRLTKYCSNSELGYNGFTDNKHVLDSEDDAAHVNWGGEWRMPSDGELRELINTNNCSWTWVTLNGVKGYKVQSKITGYTDKWIFLPATYYWSNRLSGDDSAGAQGINIGSSWIDYSNYIDRTYLAYIRPVCP